MKYHFISLIGTTSYIIGFCEVLNPVINTLVGFATFIYIIRNIKKQSDDKKNNNTIL